MDDQLYFCPGGGRRIPVKPEIFKHGNGIWLALVNHQEHVTIPLSGSAPGVILVTQLILSLVNQAVAKTDQGHISRTGVTGEIS